MENEWIHSANNRIRRKVKKIDKHELPYPVEGYGQVVWDCLCEERLPYKLQIAYWNTCWAPRETKYPEFVQLKLPSQEEIEQELVRVNKNPELRLYPGDNRIFYSVVDFIQKNTNSFA